MKRFEIITEVDARMLEPGTFVELLPGGHVTPLAADTLRERRITVVSAGRSEADALALAPRTPVKRVAVASDHTGVKLKADLVAHLRGRGLAVDDLGTSGSASVDYPDTAGAAARAVARAEADAAIVIDGAGLGSAIAANKVHGVRAAMCTTPTLARYSREHNGANVLALGATLLTRDEAIAIVDVWLDTAMTEPRYLRRLSKIHALEERERSR